MRIQNTLIVCALLGTIAGLTFVSPIFKTKTYEASLLVEDSSIPKINPKADLPDFAQKGIQYLVQVQFENGGWGAGTHANQQMIDATQVQIDPATTAFAGLALLRAGNTLEKGAYRENLKKALHYLLSLVEDSPEEGFQITNIVGTQPQAKLGRNIDVSMAMQFFIRILPYTADNPSLENRVSQSIDKCLRKLQAAQSEDGSTAGGGWAPVLQSAMSNNALELAYLDGRDVDPKVLEKSRNYQKQNLDKDGNVRSERGAGVALYSVAGSQRATAKEARKVEDLVKKAKKDGLIKEDAPLDAEVLSQVSEISKEEAERLYDAYQSNKTTISKIQDDKILAGFGNNGGEEFLSFMLTSESLLITGGEEWEQWKAKMGHMLENIQNADGSWNGHHCITSPVFCTAACILALSAENDRDLLMKERQEKK